MLAATPSTSAAVEVEERPQGGDLLPPGRKAHQAAMILGASEAVVHRAIAGSATMPGPAPRSPGDGAAARRHSCSVRSGPPTPRAQDAC